MSAVIQPASPSRVQAAQPRLALFVPSLRGGGAERVMVDLAAGLAPLGYAVDLVVARVEGPYRNRLSPEVRVVNLGAGRVVTSLPALVAYLREVRPCALLATLSHANIVALWARRLAGVPTRVVIREANTLSVASRDAPILSERLLPWLARRFYHWADAIVAVSEGVARDLTASIGVSAERVHVLPSPLVTPELPVLAAEPVNHSWFEQGQPPVVLGVGRLTRQKDFATLLRAFAMLRGRRPARLVILGEGEERPSLEALARELGVAEEIWLPGFVPNPFQYMARAGVFVLSSAWEGSPGVLVQAVASGAKVVAADCPSGPREILGAGGFGRLVPVGDVVGFADAIAVALDEPGQSPPAHLLAPYTQETAVRSYLSVMMPRAHA